MGTAELLCSCGVRHRAVLDGTDTIPDVITAFDLLCPKCRLEKQRDDAECNIYLLARELEFFHNDRRPLNSIQMRVYLDAYDNARVRLEDLEKGTAHVSTDHQC